MALILSPSLVLSAAADYDLTAPVLGWENDITVAGTSADSSVDFYPATNLANPATNLLWKSASTDVQYVTFAINEEEPIDYLGIARHNLGSGGIIVEVEVQLFDSGEWSSLIDGFVVANDAPILVRFLETTANAVRLKLTPLATPPEIAVAHVGHMMVMPVGIPFGHTPLIDGRSTRITTGNSEAGDYLGSIMLSQKLNTQLAFQYLRDDWYRANMRPFVKQGRGATFFYSGFPDSHPEEAGYAWLTSDPRPTFIEAGWVNITFEIGGIVE
ncbi:MAG TPA: hypothetical protein VGN60_01315 [Devosia sp.]|jgi:hypothetical protein|nr:hypothetical protein [Devosia sp.]